MIVLPHAPRAVLSRRGLPLCLLVAAGLSPAHAQSYQITTLAGSATVSGSADGTGSAARFNQPRGVALAELYEAP